VLVQQLGQQLLVEPNQVVDGQIIEFIEIAAELRRSQIADANASRDRRRQGLRVTF